MTDDCQTAVIVIAHTHIQSERLHTYARTHTHTRGVCLVCSVCGVSLRVVSFSSKANSFCLFFYFRVLLFQKTLFSFFLFRHLKSSLLKPASFCRPIFDDAHKFTFLTHTRTRAPASIESAAKRDGIITARLPGTINKCQIKYKHAA